MGRQHPASFLTCLQLPFSSPRLLPCSQHREETAAGSGCLRLQQLL